MNTNNKLSQIISTLLLTTLCLYLPLLLWGFWSSAIDMIILVILSVMSILAFFVAHMTLPNIKQNRFIQIVSVLLVIELCLYIPLALVGILSGMMLLNFGVIFSIVSITISIVGFINAFELLFREKRISRRSSSGLILGIFTLAAGIIQIVSGGNIDPISKLLRSNPINHFSHGLFYLGFSLTFLTLMPSHNLISIYKTLFNNTLDKDQNDALRYFAIAALWLAKACIYFSQALYGY